ncbi:hypothetical protein [Flavobacterium salmonis]|uniref:Uncharacterized protein n=1 Tax=Flavobacterium salmonis TaxID=2654844 RepID=A0A6V6Z9P1_9FLAO|nr:hypothetical protein [Flavobacterium salmonis]CAD0008164.1 hypothetical protein FLAT13_04239 [Flavobacterium salmonis]
MNEELFTKEELKQIIEEAKNPCYSEKNLMHIGSSKLSIRGVSQTNGLILVYGNESTGYKHIRERHCHSSRKPYWQDNRIDNPTKFNPNTAPIDYLFIASSIFKAENKNIEKNKNPNSFDLYIGLCKDKLGTELEYKLILYKNSKVVHTLFVNGNKKPFNKKKILNLRQGFVSSSHDLMNCIQTFNFSYFNSEDIPLFKVIIRILEVEKKEKWYIQINLNDGTPHFTTFVKELLCEHEMPVTFKMFQLDYTDITWLEKIIKQISEKKYTF